MLLRFDWLSLCCALLWLIGCGITAEEKKTSLQPADNSPSAVSGGTELRFSQQEMGPIGDGRVVEINAAGEVRLAGWDSATGEIDPRKKFFILFRERRGDEGYLTTASFIESPAGGTATLQLRQGVDKLTTEHIVLVFRPEGATDEFINNFSAVVPVSEPRPENGNATGLSRDDARAATIRSRSREQLNQISVAILNYLDVHGCYPPGIIYGPDGKPWHSWRTLILPYVDQLAMYQLYDFTQPWDSAANRDFVEINVPAFSDPIHGRNPEHYAHFGAVIGGHTLFNSVKFDGTKAGFESALNEGTPVEKISDGLANTLMIASISPEQQISWSEPRDVSIQLGIPAIDAPGGFVAVFPADGETGVLAAMADGSVKIMPKSKLTADVLRALITIDGDESLPEELQIDSSNTEPKVMIQLKSAGENSTAEFRFE